MLSMRNDKEKSGSSSTYDVSEPVGIAEGIIDMTYHPKYACDCKHRSVSHVTSAHLLSM